VVATEMRSRKLFGAPNNLTSEASPYNAGVLGGRTVTLPGLAGSADLRGASSGRGCSGSLPRSGRRETVATTWGDPSCRARRSRQRLAEDAYPWVATGDGAPRRRRSFSDASEAPGSVALTLLPSGSEHHRPGPTLRAVRGRPEDGRAARTPAGNAGLRGKSRSSAPNLPLRGPAKPGRAAPGLAILLSPRRSAAARSHRRP
jgi:hypothetical protein